MADWNWDLIMAAREGNPVKLKLCLDHGADLEYKDEIGWTAFLWAAFVGCLEVAHILNERGCNKLFTNVRGETALHLAAMYGRLNVTKYLVEQAGISIMIRANEGETPYNLAAEPRAWPQDKNMKTVANYLQDIIKDRNAKLITASRDGNLHDVKIWLGNGADIDYEEYGMTAFMFAAREGHLEITRLLLENRCKKDITDRAGRTALHLASQNGNLEITRYLVEVGGLSPLVETHQGQTPYNLAAEWKIGLYEKVMEYLQTAMSENSSGGTAGQEKEDVMVPSEIKLMADKRSIDLYLKLLESGSEKKRDIRLVVVGKKGAGKTSLIRRLFGEDITNVTSTNGIEIHKIKCKAMSNDGIWDKLDGKIEESKIHARILKPIEGMLSYIEEENTKTSVNEAGACEANKPGKFVDELNELGTEKVNPEVEFTVPTQQPNNAFKLAEQDFKTMLKSEVDFDDKEEYATLLLWDFAGDEEFYHSHQTFLSPDAIYLVVTKLNEADDKKAQEMFQLWMNSIHCYCRLDDQKNNPSNSTTESDERMRKKTKYFDPPVVVVGSHKDKIKPTPGEELVNACKKCIDKYVNEVPRDAQQHIQDEHFVSNTVMTANEDLIFQKIRQAILVLARKMRTWNTDYPLKFIQLEKYLQKKKKELPIISIQELSQIANEIPMPLNEKELIMFLKFHHETRTLVYFDDLPDYIILDTQWLSDIFKCIITSKKFQLSVSRHQFSCEWDDFYMKGKLHSVVLDQILETNPAIFKFEERLNSYKHKDHILSVMEKFDIIISPNIPDKDADDDNPPYYVPCMIKAEPESDIYEMFHVSDTCNKSTWLCFKFTFLPPHLKNHLIASLSRKYEIADVPVCEPNERPIALFKSTAVFQLQEAAKLLVMSFVDHIQIQVLEFGHYDNIDKCFYRNIADFVTVEIKNIISKRFKMTTVIFDQKLECCLQKSDCVKGSCVWHDKKSDYFCDICTKRHDNEWSEHLPVKEHYLEPIVSESITYNFEDTKEHKIDFNDILDELMTRLVISVDDRRCIELNVSQEAKEQKLLEIVNKRGETNKTVCIDVLKQNSGYDDLTIELTKTISVTSPTDNRELQDVPDYKVRLQKNYLHIINTIKHDNQ